MPAGPPVTALRRLWQPCRFSKSLAAIVAAILLVGCSQDEAIVVETVPKDEAARTDALKPKPPSDRMLAAIVPHGGTAFFFKLTGSIDEVAELRPEFLNLLKSVTFENGQPQWVLPSGWTQSAGTGMRIATITVPGDSANELSVTSLTAPDGDLAAYRLENVNRWRKQMGLSPIDADRLETAEDPRGEIFTFKLANGTDVTLVDFAGHFEGGMMAPFAGQAGSG
ncbi:MAG: hypothetical protein M3552_09235 [Planctomycetota bacterium]|nr:hypothetical protein [Planctomycetaceae bacterium]MDQ3330822.1 hypothetical protein [Planctomycetota bacterium]